MPISFPNTGSSSPISSSISFATAIPLTSGAQAYMPQQTITSALAFTAAALPVQNSSVYVRLIANGSNVPTFTGFLEWGGSQGWNNSNGIVNQIEFFYDGYDKWFSISQAVGAVAVPGSATVPGAPTIGTATAGDTSATVAFTAPVSNGGAVIIDYTATSTPGSFTGVITQAGSGTITVTGLTNGTAYTFTVHARNSVGNSAESAASNSATPAVASSAFLRAVGGFGTVTESGDGTIGYSYTTADGTWDNAAHIVTTPKLAVGAWFSMDMTGASADGMMGVHSNATAVPYNYATPWEAGIYPSGGSALDITNGAVGGTDGTFTTGDRLRLRRTTTTAVVLEKSTDSGATWGAATKTWTVPSGVLYAVIGCHSGVSNVRLRGQGLTA